MTRALIWLAASSIAWSTPLLASEPQPDELVTTPPPAKNAAGFAAPVDYAKMVARLQSGASDVDFTALREAAMAAPNFSGYNMLDRTKVEEAAQAKDWKKVIALCDEHLKSDYTDINAHTYEALAHRKLGETELADKHRRIWTGLFEAILKSGDGQSPKTAFRVVGVDEEYFLMHLLHLKLERQALVTRDGVFDKLDVIGEDGTKRQLWFDISGFFGKLGV